MQNALVEAFALNNANYNHKNTVFLQIIKALSSKSFFFTQKKCGKIAGKCEFLKQIALWGKVGGEKRGPLGFAALLWDMGIEIIF